MVVKNSSKKEVSRLKEWRLDGVTKAKVEQNYTKELADEELEVARLTNKWLEALGEENESVYYID